MSLEDGRAKTPSCPERKYSVLFLCFELRNRSGPPSSVLLHSYTSASPSGF